MTVTDRLWVPLLTHYRRDAGGGVAIDIDRMAAQARSIAPHVRQIMVAGSTGDGWALSDDGVISVVTGLPRLAAGMGTVQVLIGVLRPDTEGVVNLATRVEETLAGMSLPNTVTVTGLTVCPPCNPNADAADQRAHFDAILRHTRLPFALYELPQVTGCHLDAGVLRDLAREDRCRIFKDSSGQDLLAASGAAAGLISLRGAEGGYAAALAAGSGYDGWLLSTGNAFAPELRRVDDLLRQGHQAVAERLSDAVAEAASRIFLAAAGLPFANPFSNANRALDHLSAWGEAAMDVPPPLCGEGLPLPPDLLSAASACLSDLRGELAKGYLHQT